MNKAKLKSYAPQARKDFIAAVTARANLLGLSENAGKLEVASSQPQGDVTMIAGQAWPSKVHGQRQQLIARIQKDGFAQTMEAVAYTWFNRFAALRYMELHDYLGHGYRALSSEEGTLPDILTHAAELAHNGSGEGGLPGLKPALVTEMKLAGNRDGELYRMLLVAQCNALSNVMPFLFERIDDETELLLPDNLLRTDSVIAKLVASIEEDDWKEVEIIGWLYQFYISEKKDEVIGKVVKSEDIPAATQLFTPNWIVQYLVQNSVGRLWLMANPSSTLQAQWPYYIAPAEQTPEVQAQLNALIQTRMDEDGGSLNPETITMLDPACGSGHILVEGYEVFKAIYLERGYQPRTIPRLILEKNLYGLDIDDRAAQMAGFALLMKARADDRRLFNEPIELNVLSLKGSGGLDAEELTRALQNVASGVIPQVADSTPSSRFGDDDLFPGTRAQFSLGESGSDFIAEDPIRQAIAALIATFTHAKTLGSLIQITPALNMQLAAMAECLQLALHSADLYAKAAAQDLLPLIVQARILGMQFDAVVANPPYMGGKFMNVCLKDFSKQMFPTAKSDLFACFVDRGRNYVKVGGYIAYITMDSWMFLPSYSDFRKSILHQQTIQSLIHVGWNCFPEGHTYNRGVIFVLGGALVGTKGFYMNLSDVPAIVDKNELFKLRRFNSDANYSVDQEEFWKIPGNPISYWLDKKIVSLFVNKKISDLFEVREGLGTRDDAIFMRYHWEVSIEKIRRIRNSGEKWIKADKAGKFRRWFGNQIYVLNWENSGYAIKNHKNPDGSVKSRPQNTQYFFRDAVSWGKVGSGITSFRYRDNIGGFTDAAPSIFGSDVGNLIGLLNSKVFQCLLEIQGGTLNVALGIVGGLPVVNGALNLISTEISKNAISVSRLDWDEFECSMEFKHLFFVINGKTSLSLEESWAMWAVEANERVNYLHSLEERNNRHFIEAYGLQNEVSSEVPETEITLARADREKDSQRLISYAIGCMMGRYSLDEPGLIYANAGNIGFDDSRYASFPADADGIVPLNDELWFEDEVASRIREFLLAVWDADTLAENMAWLAESLGAKAGETPDETIRRYLADKFYKDHLQTYKKRPIYWLFSSGKQGAFQALVYLHRYHEGTLARMRAEYVVPLTGKIQSRIDMLEKDAAAASSTAARNKLAKEVEKLKKKQVELLAYDEQLRHYADMRIALDLDDGVKVNYGKFGTLLAEVKAVTGGTSDD